MTKAVVLARGLGTRMRQEAEAGPRLDARQVEAADHGLKAMMPVGPGGRPFLDFILSALADAGYAEACLVIGPDAQAQRIREHYTTVAPPRRLRIAFAVQAEPRGTADALLAAEPFADGEHVLVINGDNYYPVAALRALRELNPASAGTVLFEPEALVRTSNIPADRLRAFALGVVSADGALTDLIEKPDDETWRALTAAASPVGSSAELLASTSVGSSAPLPARLPTGLPDAAPTASRAASRALISMNCWRVSPAIFPICRALTPSSRGELELPQAIRNAIAAGVRFAVVRSDEGVLDLSRRADVAAVADRLRDVRVDV